MTAKRAFYAMIGGIVLLVGLCAAGTYFANKMLVAEGSKLLDLKLQEAVLAKQEASLTQAKKDIAEYEDLEKIARTVVPQEKDQARTTLELLNLARDAGITISSISFPDSQLGEVQKGKAAAPAAEGEEAKEGEQKAAPAKPVDSKTTQLTPLKNLKGVYAMEITVESDAEELITYQQLLDYLRKLENNRRTAEVKNISIQPSDENRNLLSFTLTLNSYVRP